ncbi:MAG: hypothetical protein Kow0068_04490 [Marinilabiliales bacterium]
MKKLIYLTAILFAFALFSCNSGDSEAKDENNEDVKKQEKVDEKADNNNKATSGELSDCDEFLDDYEAWVTEYLEAMAKFVNDPTDMEASQNYMELAQKAQEWTTKWINLVKCAGELKYQARFDEISKKTEEKMEELGLK